MIKLLKSKGLEFHVTSTPDLVYSTDGLYPSIIRGTVQQLVQHLSFEDFADEEYYATFFMTYHTFANSHKVFASLKESILKSQTEKATTWKRPEREDYLPPPGPFAAFHYWILNFFDDFGEDSNFLQTVLEFTKTLPPEHKEIEIIFSKKTQEALEKSSAFEQRFRRVSIDTGKLSPKPSEMGSKLFGNLSSVFKMQSANPQTWYVDKVLCITKIPSELFAQQLALCLSIPFSNVTPTEFIAYGFYGTSLQTDTPKFEKVNSFLSLTKSLSNWMSHQILREKYKKDRAKVIQKIISIAHHSLILRNFQAVAFILEMLASHPISRLFKTWSTVGKPSQLEEMCKLFSTSGNYERYRNMIQEFDEGVPYLTPHLKQISIATPRERESERPDHTINFEAHTVFASQLQLMKRFQAYSYPFQEDTFLQAFLAAPYPTASPSELLKKSFRLEDKN